MRSKKPARHTVSILTGRKKTRFSHVCSSVILHLIGTSFAAEVPARWATPHTKFEENRLGHFRDLSAQKLVFVSSFFFFLFSVFSHTLKNCYKTQTRIPITLKSGTHKGSPMSNPSIKFGANLVNDSGVMIDHSCKTRSIYCHSYRVNHFME